MLNRLNEQEIQKSIMKNFKDFVANIIEHKNKEPPIIFR
jgi:hypothetical protein